MHLPIFIFLIFTPSLTICYIQIALEKIFGRNAFSLEKDLIF